MLTKAPRGTYDALPGKIERYQYIEQVFREVAETFGYREIRTPVFEHTELFERGVGSTTDIVQKEMYTFTDRGDRSITLRPEGTAPVVRAFVEHKLYGQSIPVKFYYSAMPIFRYERPQAGRLRQHHQFGVELFGSQNPRVDVEVIDLLYTFYTKLGLKQLNVQINSVGCPECRQVHRQELLNFLSSVKDELCHTCRDRLERNPMRILDCKNKHCQELTANAPVTTDYLCEPCAEHYQEVKLGLDLIGLPYKENDRLVRGLDYYTKTAFEIGDLALTGSINVIGAGGRYDGLVEQIGGPSMPGIGFGCGLERLELACEAEGVELPTQSYCDVYIVLADDIGRNMAFEVLHRLRQHGIAADMDYQARSMRSQLKQASKLQAQYAMIIGEAEVEGNVITIKDLSSGEQEVLPLQEALIKLNKC